MKITSQLFYSRFKILNSFQKGETLIPSLFFSRTLFKSLFLIACVFHCQFSLGQNLIPNASFENYFSCPTAPDQVDSVIDWFSVLESPDYFNSCALAWQVSVPINFGGHQPAHTGNAYCGMFCYYPPNYREYVGSHLDSVLVPGQKYFVSFYLNLAQNYHMATNNFGCKLSTQPIAYNSLSPDNNASFYTNTIVNDTIGWTFIKGSFIADSAYQFVAFGNFFDDNNTDTLSGGGASSYHGYLFIDDVCLSPDSSVCSDQGSTENVITNSLNINCSVSPNPCHDYFSIYTSEKVTSIKLINLFGGEILFEDNIPKSLARKQINVSSLRRGIYLLKIIINNTTYSKKIVIQ